MLPVIKTSFPKEKPLPLKSRQMMLDEMRLRTAERAKMKAEAPRGYGPLLRRLIRKTMLNKPENFYQFYADYLEKEVEKRAVKEFMIDEEGNAPHQCQLPPFLAQSLFFFPPIHLVESMYLLLVTGHFLFFRRNG